MAMAPKKKYEYFDRGRGISDLSIYDNADQSDSSNSPRPQSYDVSTSGSSTRHSSPFQGPPSPLDYPSNTMSPHLPYATQPTYHPTPYQDYHQALTMGGHYQPEMPEPSGSYSGPYARYVPSDAHRGCRGRGEGGDGMNGDLPHTYAVDDDEEEPQKTSKTKCPTTKAQKRPQRCRMCANHGKTVDMKGHKWYCPFRECTCNDCDITRKTQYYMKERQKLTRHQQQQQNEERNHGGTQGGPDTSRRRMSDQSQMDFPRVDEMVSQTRNILDYELFERVNQACRPRSSSNIPH